MYGNQNVYGSVTWHFKIVKRSQPSTLTNAQVIFPEEGLLRKELAEDPVGCLCLCLSWNSLLIVILFGFNSSSSLWTQNPLLSTVWPSITMEICWSQEQLTVSSGYLVCKCAQCDPGPLLDLAGIDAVAKP